MAIRAEALDEADVPRMRLLKARSGPTGNPANEALVWFERAARWERRLDELRATGSAPESDRSA